MDKERLEFLRKLVLEDLADEHITDDEAVMLFGELTSTAFQTFIGDHPEKAEWVRGIASVIYLHSGKRED